MVGSIAGEVCSFVFGNLLWFLDCSPVRLYLAEAAPQGPGGPWPALARRSWPPSASAQYSRTALQSRNQRRLPNTKEHISPAILPTNSGRVYRSGCTSTGFPAATNKNHPRVCIIILDDISGYVHHGIRSSARAIAH